MVDSVTGSMENNHIGFIGGGNMAGSIIGGLCANDSGHAIFVSDPDSGKLNQLETEFGVIPCANNADLMEQVDVVILSVKPQVMKEVLTSLRSAYGRRKPVMISIAAGIRCHQILDWLNCSSAPCIRVMPNTPALVRTGASGLFAVNASLAQQQAAQSIMEAVGITVWLEDESLIDAVTGVSGSGPAYFFYLMEAVYNAGIKNGLSEAVARDLTLQTALGSAKLALDSDVDFKTLRQRVTSPGGTTEAAIQSLQSHNFSDLIENAVNRAVMRSDELSGNV